MPPEERAEANSLYAPPGDTEVEGDFSVLLVLLPRVVGDWKRLPKGKTGARYGASYLPFKVADIFVGKVERLGEWIRTGQFDSLLVRPLGTLGQTLTADVDMKQVGGLAQGVVVFGIALAHVNIDWTPGRALMMILMLASGFVIFCSVWIATNAAAFWLVNIREAANAFTYGGNFLTQYPLDILGPWFRRLFAFLIPMAFVNYFPSVYLLDKPIEPWPDVEGFRNPSPAPSGAPHHCRGDFPEAPTLPNGYRKEQNRSTSPSTWG